MSDVKTVIIFNEILLTDPFAKNIEMTKEIFKKQGYEF